MPVSASAVEERDFSCGHRNGLEIKGEVSGQFLEAPTPSVLCRRPKSQVLRHMLAVDPQEQSP